MQLAVTGATALLLEAALDFLGLGTAPPEPSWGSLLGTAQDYIFQTPWYGLFPGIVGDWSGVVFRRYRFRAPGDRRRAEPGVAPRSAPSCTRADRVAIDVALHRPPARATGPGRLDRIRAGMAAHLPCAWRSRGRTRRTGCNTGADPDRATSDGSNQPLPVQYALWLSAAVRGDLGRSLLTQVPVVTLLAQRIPVTLHLAVASAFIHSRGVAGSDHRSGQARHLVRALRLALHGADARRSHLLARDPVGVIRGCLATVASIVGLRRDLG